MFPEPSSLILLRLSVSFFLFIFLCFPASEASSSGLRPLKRIAEPSVSLQLYSRTQQLWRKSLSSASGDGSPSLSHSDSFRMSVSAYGETYYLHLRPNDHLLHPSARIKYYKTGVNGEVVLNRTEPLVRNNVKAYLGDVIHPDETDGRLQEDLAGGLSNSRYQSLGWARIMVYDEGNPEVGIPPHVEGAFSINGVPHHIMTREKYIKLKHPHDPTPDTRDRSLVIFRDSDITSAWEEQALLSGLPNPAGFQNISSNQDSHSCTHDHLEWNRNTFVNPVFKQPKQPTWLDELVYGNTWANVNPNASIWRRDDIVGNNMDTNFASHIGQTTGCPVDQTVIYMGVAADCKYVQQHGSPENATMAILNDWNMASSVYKQTFNVNLAIVEISIQDSTCPTFADPAFPWNVDCNAGVTLNDRLSLFSQWRGTKSNDQAGLWHLMSGCPTGTEIGVAWLGTLCQTTTTGSPGQFVSGTAVTTTGRSEWQVVAHEIGHNFGAIHDCVSGCSSSTLCCPLSTSQCDSNSQFIMSPTSQPNEVKFSQCSIGNICSLMQSKTTNTTCLQPPNPNIRTISLQMCGNGIIEGDEECDPGIGVNSTCCDQKTCKFTSGAVCDPSNGACCTSQCQFAPSTQVCRPSVDSQCDLTETCNGTSAQCPWDRTQPNGLSCGPNGQACASGQCTSLALQCQMVGASLGLESACSAKGDTSCQVSCQTPGTTSECTVLQAQLIDGSPCGFGGSCSNGDCVPGSILDTVKSWYRQNLQIAIPITVISALFLFFILWTLIRCLFRRDCCCRRYPRKIVIEPAITSVPPQRLTSWMGPSVSQQANVSSSNPPSAWAPPPRGQQPRQQRRLQKMSVNQSVDYSNGSSVTSHSRGSSYVSDAHSSVNYHPVSPAEPNDGAVRPARSNSMRTSNDSLYPSWIASARRSQAREDRTPYQL